MSEQNRASSYCRVLRMRNDPRKVDEGIKLWTTEILPLQREQKGFGGATLTGNRSTGYGLTVMYWVSELAMKEARDQVRPRVLTVLEKTGATIAEEDEFEVAILERFTTVTPGVWARITTGHLDPAQADMAIANFKEQVVPSIGKQWGSRTALFFVNRQSGKTIVGSVWDTEQDLQRSEATIGDLHAESLKKFGDHDPRTEAFQIFSTEIPALTLAG